MNGTDVAGYLYREQMHCPSCTRDLFVPFEMVGRSRYTPEEALDLAAQERGIFRGDENSFSSYQFPKPVYQAEVSRADRCQVCGRRLGGAEASM